MRRLRPIQGRDGDLDRRRRCFGLLQKKGLFVDKSGVWAAAEEMRVPATLNSSGVVVAAQPEASVGRRYQRLRSSAFPYLLIAPIALLLLAVSFYPALYAVWLATSNATLLAMSRARFIGLENFVHLAEDPVWLGSIWRTLRWDAVIVGSELLIALPVALIPACQFFRPRVRSRRRAHSLHPAAGRYRPDVDLYL